MVELISEDMRVELIIYNRNNWAMCHYETNAVPKVGDWIRVKGEKYIVLKRLFRAGSNTIEIYV